MKHTSKSIPWTGALIVLIIALALSATLNYADDPPNPGEGGGGSVTNTWPEAYSTPGLKLYQPQFEGEHLRFWILEGETNGVYDLFVTPTLETNRVWYHWARTAPGETNFLAYHPGTTNAFFLLGTMQDSDSDGLTDAYELLVSLTSTNSANAGLDSDGDGIPDHVEIAHGLSPSHTDAPLSLTLAAPAGHSPLP